MQANSTSGDFDTRVRQRLRELRMQHGLTLEDVAARASIDISTLSRLESGKRRPALDHVPPCPGGRGRCRLAPTNGGAHGSPPTPASGAARTPATASPTGR